MVKKKMSGQTIVIIILAIMLLLTVGFGGVFMFYSARSNKVSGEIIMANLKIGMYSLDEGSKKSEIVISNGKNIVPGQPLNNSSLLVTNESLIDVYLIVVYRINAVKKVSGVDVEVEDLFIDPVIGIGSDYYNPYANKTKVNATNDKEWVDYVFTSDAKGTLEKYRCLVSMKSYPTTKTEPIPVIKKDNLMLAGDMNNDFQSTTISFTFQAYAIAAATDFGFTSATTVPEKCQKIVNAIYVSQDKVFLNAKATVTE